MQKQCRTCSKTFLLEDADLAFCERVSPVIAGVAQSIPPPQCCPDCRQQRRTAFRNDSFYYRNTCHLCGKPVISIYSPDKTVPVLCHDCCWSDRWDPLAYGVPFDPSRSFFAQYAEMRAKVPRIAIFNTQSENSEYTVHSSKNRNCYMCCSTVECEDVEYSDWMIRSTDCMDGLMGADLELCYGCAESRESFGSDYLDRCSNTSTSYLCFDCHRSTDLVGCVSVRGGSAMILNERSTREGCQRTIQRLKTDPAFRAQFEAKYAALNARLPKKYAWNLNTEGCTGDALTNCKNAVSCFHSEALQDCRHVYDATEITDAMDLTRGSSCEMLYECKAGIDLKLSAFCNLCYQCDRLLYCDNCQGTSECFGCFGLKKHRYCILNRQYTKEEYEKLVPQIIAHMKQGGEYGEFFPVPLSAFGYNETKAQEWFPMTREEVTRKGWRWSEYEPPRVTAAKTIPASQLPPDIAAVPDDILQWAIISEGNGKPFRIVPQELAFYRKKGLPIPHFSWQERHLARKAKQNPCTLYKRSCAKCDTPIETTYAPDRPETVYCEACFLQTVS